MNNDLQLSLAEKFKYNPVTAPLYRAYFCKRALRTGEPELHTLEQLAPKGRVALDIGSNKGVFSYLLARQGLEVHAFEPIPLFYQRLDRTAPGNLTCHNIALSNQDGEADFHIPLLNGRILNQVATLRDLGDHNECITIQVKTRKLDSLGLKNIGFIKIDAEGFEKQILEGGLETIARDRPVMLIEIEESHTGEDLWTSLKFVESLGYTTHGFHDGRVQPLEDFFDIERHHRAPSGGRYYNNFIFLPIEQE
jgi:FkbM family methyltransferase